MKYATAIIFTLALLVTGACGGGEYQAPAKSNSKPVVQTNTTTTPGNKPTGPSMEKEYTAAAKAAFAAQGDFRNDKTADNFALWGARMYDALRLQIEHSRHGRSTEGFYRIKDIKEMKTDFLKTLGPVGWEDNEEYKAAKHAYNEVQQGS